MTQLSYLQNAAGFLERALCLSGFLLPVGTCSLHAKAKPGQEPAPLLGFSPLQRSSVWPGSLPLKTHPLLYFHMLWNAPYVAHNVFVIRCLFGEFGCLQVWVGAEQSSVTESILKPCFAEDLIRAPLRATPASTCKVVFCQRWTSGYSLIMSLSSDGGHKARGRWDISRTNLFFGYTGMS